MHMLIAVLLGLVILSLLLWAVQAMPFIPATIKSLLQVILVLFAALWMVDLLGVFGPPHWRSW